MPQRTAYIVSAKFAPGLKKEFRLLGDSLESRGVPVQYLLAGAYRDLQWDHPNTSYITAGHRPFSMAMDMIRLASGKRLSRILTKSPPGVLYFYNTHPINPLLAAAAKREFPRVKVVLHLHDPYKPDKSPYGTRAAMRITIVEAIQKWTAMRADHIVFPSPYSLELFEKHYRCLPAAKHVAPLLVPDHPNGVVLRRRYFCMVGRMHHATGHDTFLNLVNHVAAENLPYRFALICADDLSQYLSRVSPEGKKVLTVISKPLIDDSEIDAVLRESYAVFRLAREVTQSGVIPVAYMNHTPVIARDIRGLRQHVSHKQDGYLVPAECAISHLLEAMLFVKDNFVSLSENARRRYEETWSQANWDTHYSWMVDLLKNHEAAYSKS